jgi:non-specific serine/threonine protein kinase
VLTDRGTTFTVTEVQPAPLLGRDRELALIDQLLMDGGAPLLTLIGPAGVGKTRLAHEAGQRCSGRFPDGVWWVDLSALRDPDTVASAIAQSLDLRQAGPDPLVDRLATYVHGRDLLLVLDNFEQVLPAAHLVDTMMAAAPGLKILVTSREVLHLRSEQALPVQPLSLPDPDHLPPLEDLAQVPAVALFLQRAQRIDPGFELTGRNARSVAELVVHLDGLPLAIELAAARSRLLSPHMLLERLGRRLSILHWEAQDLPERQQTLRGAIAWSYDLLSPSEQCLFRSLAVFSGGFTLEAVEAIAGPGSEASVDALEGLASLVAKSLVLAEEDGRGGYRFRLFESVREFALELMRGSDEWAEVGLAHARYFLATAEHAVRELAGPKQQDSYLRLEREHDNLRTALHWSLEHGRHDLALRLAATSGWFWLTRGYHTEGSRWLADVLSATPGADPALRLPALLIAGMLLNDQMRVAEARPVLDEALLLAEETQDRREIAEALTFLGGRAYLANDLSEATSLLDDAIARWETLGDTGPGINYQAGLAYGYRAGVAFHQGDLDRAIELLRATLARHDANGDAHSASATRFYLAALFADKGNVQEGVPLVRDGLSAIRTFQDRLLLTLGMDATFFLALSGEDQEEQARLLGAVDAQQASSGLGESGGVLARRLVPKAERLRELIGQRQLEAAYREGRALTGDAAIELALAALERLEGSPRPAPAAPARPTQALLSDREMDVLRLVAQGMTNKQIARELFIAESTAKTYVTGIFNKLGVDSRAHAVAVATQRGLI